MDNARVGRISDQPAGFGSNEVMAAWKRHVIDLARCLGQ